MNRRMFLNLGIYPFVPVLLPPEQPKKCEHAFREWPRTAYGEDRIRQCIHCGDKERLKMEWATGTVKTSFDGGWFPFGRERAVGNWTPDGNSNPRWIREMKLLA